MALKKKSAKLIWVEAKNGKLSIGKKVGEKDGRPQWENEYFSELEGVVTSVEKKDKPFKDKMISKVYVNITDGDERYVLYWTENSYATYGFASQILSVDLSKPVSFQAWNYKEGDKATFLSLYQDGKKIESDPNFPKPVNEKTRSGNVMNYDDMLLAWDGVLEKLVSVLGVRVEEKDDAGGAAVEDEQEIPF